MDEQQLIERCRRGDEGAWAELYAARGPSVARFLQHMMAPGADLDDLVQQVFVELFRSLDRFRGDASLATFLFGIATRVALHHLRGARRWRRRTEALAAEPADAVAPDAHGRVEARGHLAVVAEALEGLAPEVRAVWVMRELEGLSTAEVAVALATREGTVRSRLFAARRHVLDALASAAQRVRGLDQAGEGRPGGAKSLAGRSSEPGGGATGGPPAGETGEGERARALRSEAGAGGAERIAAGRAATRGVS